MIRAGATQFGITIGTLRDWRHDDGLTAEDVKKLGRDEACEIYRTRYWNVLRCDDLPTGVDLVAFDFARQRQARGGQPRRCSRLSAPPTDSSIGDATLAATKAMPPRDVIKEMSNRRLDYYRIYRMRISLNRTAAVEKTAMEMIDSGGAGNVRG